jgi:DNA-binding NarL/FixJ family response regulator
MTNVIIPSSDEDRKRIRGAMEEISNSYTRTEAERDFVKEAIESLSEEVDIPKNILRKMARIFHKQNITDVVSEVEDIEALMESI